MMKTVADQLAVILAVAGVKRISGIAGDSLNGLSDATAFAHDGPVLIDAVVNRTELAMPSAITVEMAKGFPLHIAKAIPDGRVGEVADLGKTSFQR
jgi:thiamine pyrophosphate-dependent acetolactate synthase large subunit-like protein